jgi:xanthine/CO dehydrogenase XdhC/CoxF family maturation factor
MLCLMAVLAACATATPVDDPRKVWCDSNRPTRPSAAVFAVMTRPELDDMNRHNALGAQWCGWKP